MCLPAPARRFSFTSARLAAALFGAVAIAGFFALWTASSATSSAAAPAPPAAPARAAVTGSIETGSIETGGSFGRAAAATSTTARRSSTSKAPSSPRSTARPSPTTTPKTTSTTTASTTTTTTTTPTATDQIASGASDAGPPRLLVAGPEVGRAEPIERVSTLTTLWTACAGLGVAALALAGSTIWYWRRTRPARDVDA